MKPGDLVRLNPAAVIRERKKSFPLYTTPTIGQDTTDSIRLDEIFVILEVMFPGDPQVTEVRLLTPRGTTGWNVGKFFEVLSETR